MKRIWRNIKTFFKNLKKLYRLSQRISFYDNTVLFYGSVETTRHIKAGHNIYQLTQYFPPKKAEEEYEELLRKETERLPDGDKDRFLIKKGA